MGTKDPTRTLQFSYSSTGSYKTCPRQFKHLNLRGDYQSPEHPATIRGSEMHDSLEDAINYGTDYEYHDYQWILDDFREQTGLKVPEMQLGTDINWNAVAYDHEDSWYRGKIDMTCINGTHADVTDLKTGKRRIEVASEFEKWLIPLHEQGMKTAPKILANARQASDYALLIFLHFEELETITFRFVWSDVEGIPYDTFNFDRTRDLPNLSKTLLYLPTLILRSQKLDDFPPNPSGLCYQHCPVSRDECEYVGMRWREIQKKLNG